jgi:AraC-like DNA-binding protein
MTRHEWSRHTYEPQLDVELLHAVYKTHAFPRHMHDYYVVCQIEDGCQSFTYRGAKHHTGTGALIVLHPGEPHTGEPADEWGFEYRAIYPTVAHMQQAVAEVTGHTDPLPFFAEVPIIDPVLSCSIRTLHRVLCGPSPPLERESRLLWILAQLIIRHGDLQVPAQPRRQERRAVRRARDYLAANLAQGTTLRELAAEVGLSPYYLLRVFRDEVGMPPHAYLESMRVQEAQRLLKQGEPLAAVAHDLGFNSQSHFTTSFRRIIGVTPGQYMHYLRDGVK